MSISLYDVSIPIFTLSLNNLSAILDKAASYGEAKKVDPKALPQARLIVDMLPLSAQIQIACDTAKECCRPTGREGGPEARGYGGDNRRSEGPCGQDAGFHQDH